MVTRQTAKQYGAETQALVAQWYQRLWPAATSAGAGAPGRDVLNVPVDIEAKGRAGFNPLAWIKQQKDRGVRPDDILPPHTVLRPKGIGPANVGSWLVIRPLAEDTALLAELLELRKSSAGAHRTKTGKVLTEAELDEYVTEAERGYDLDKLPDIPGHAGPGHTPDGPADCSRCQLLRDNQGWMEQGNGSPDH